MTIASQTVRNNYTANGSLNTYTYGFRIDDEGDLLVKVMNTDDEETTLVLTTDYTVTGVGETSGGTIVLVSSGQAWLSGGNLRVNYKISIRRDMDLVQSTDIRNQGDFYPETHEDQFDAFVMQAQQIQDQVTRSVKLADCVPVAGFDPTLPTDIAGSLDKLLGTNAAGDGFTMSVSITDFNADVAATAAAAIAAAASEAAAALSETAAATSETNAAASEAAAAASEAAAAASESAAATSETNAATSETNAAASEAAAAASAIAADAVIVEVNTFASPAIITTTITAPTAQRTRSYVAGSGDVVNPTLGNGSGTKEWFIVGTSTNTVELNSTTNLVLSGKIILGAGSVLALQWFNGQSKWYEVGRNEI